MLALSMCDSNLAVRVGGLRTTLMGSLGRTGREEDRYWDDGLSVLRLRNPDRSGHFFSTFVAVTDDVIVAGPVPDVVAEID